MALEGWIFVAFIILVVIVVIKAVNKKQAIAVKLVVGLFIFFALSIGYVMISNNIKITNFDSFLGTIKIYFSWIATITDNLTKVSGYAVNQDWSLNTTQVNK